MSNYNSSLPRLLLLALFAIPLRATFADSTTPDTTIAAAVKEFTGAHTRMVWLEDGEDTPHPWGGPKMKLMVLDTDDGKGIHPLFPDIAGYSWPHATPDGKGIVFNFGKNPAKPNKDLCVMYVNWDGTGRREVLPSNRSDGFSTWCSCITQDPDGTIWLYCDMKPQDGKSTHSMRFRLDKPSVSEPVYDHYLGRLTASPDGKLVAGVYESEGGAPTGVYDIANATWHFMAQGCQPFLLPCTNPYRYWVCDGGHRGGRMFTNPTLQGKTVYRHFDLRSAPNMGGTEVRYPHWSNDVHFMAVDSPYPVQTKPFSQNPPQCKKTEICLAKFDKDLTKIEKWLQVTNNSVGDYFASTWIDTSQLPAASQPVPAATSTPATATAQPSPAAPPAKPEPAVAKNASSVPAWPGNNTGLVYLWENAESSNEIIDAAGKHSMCILDGRDAAIFGRYGVMDLSGGSFSAKPGSTTTMLDACRRSGAFSIEAVIHPEGLDANQQSSTLVSFASGTLCNVVLAMTKNALTLRLHTSLNPADSVINLGTIKNTGPQHVVITFERGFVTSYLNGRPAAVNGNIPGDLQAWIPAPLVFGDDYSGGHNWPGILEGIAIYSRALNALEAFAHCTAYTARIVNRQKPVQRVEVSARLYEITPNSIPDAIRPYRRLLVVDSYEVVSVLKGTCDAKKISVAHWGILNDRVVALDREIGKTYDLVLEPMEDNSQLESECTHNDSADVTLPLYYDVDKHVDKLGAKPAE